VHIIDELIEERAKKLMARPWLWRLIKPFLYKALGYTKAVQIADAVKPLSGRQAFELVSGKLLLDEKIKGEQNIPRTGAVIIIANHPTGLADGVFVFNALKARRAEHVFMANADALRVIPKAEDIIIPVEWVKKKRSLSKTRTTLVALNQALAAQKAVVIFPAGVLAHLSWRGLVDKPWNPTAINTARKHNIPIIPLHIKSRNSALYYIFSRLNNELRDITLFRELFNKKGQSPVLTFGPAIKPETLPKGSKAASEYVRRVVEGRPP